MPVAVAAACLVAFVALPRPQPTFVARGSDAHDGAVQIPSARREGPERHPTASAVRISCRPCAPGAEVRIALPPPRVPSYAAAALLSADGLLLWVLPGDDGAAVAVEPGRRLEKAARLPDDAPLGAWRVYALVDEAPVTRARLRAPIEQTASGAPPPGLHETSFVVGME